MIVNRKLVLTLASVCALSWACSAAEDGNGGSGGQAGTLGNAAGSAAGGSSAAGSGAGGTNTGVAGSDSTVGNAGTTPVAGAGAGGAAGAAAGGAAGEAAAGAAGTAGAAQGGGGAGGGGSSVPGQSAGCGQPIDPNTPLREYVQHDIMVQVDPEWVAKGYDTREYHVMLPDGYDATKPYALYLWGTGCGATHGNAEGIPMNQVQDSHTQVIYVFTMQEEGCFQAGSSGTANTPDVPYITQILDEMEAAYCVDTNKEFLAGWSSGAWLAATMSCALGDRLRGIGMSTGGQQPELMPCTGPVAALMFVGTGDGTNPIAGDTGSHLVHERLVAENGCMDTTQAWDARWPDCQIHDGCGDNPVVWCPHGGGHTPDNGTDITSNGHWEFFMNLP